MDLPVPGGRQKGRHDRLLPLVDPQRQSREALSGKGPSRAEGLGEANETQHRQGPQLRRRNRRVETRREARPGNRTPAGKIPEQRARGRPWQAQIVDQARAWFQIDADSLRHDQGLRGHARPAQRASPGMVPAARDQGRGASDRKSIWHWPLGHDRGHGRAQSAFCQCCLIPRRGDAARPSPMFATEPFYDPPIIQTKVNLGTSSTESDALTGRWVIVAYGSTIDTDNYVIGPNSGVPCRTAWCDMNYNKAPILSPTGNPHPISRNFAEQANSICFQAHRLRTKAQKGMESLKHRPSKRYRQCKLIIFYRLNWYISYLEFADLYCPKRKGNPFKNAFESNCCYGRLTPSIEQA